MAATTRSPISNAAATRPDAIVHEATALAWARDFRRFDRSFAQTVTLMTERRLEREGDAGARLDAALPDVARGFRAAYARERPAARGGVAQARAGYGR
jgi:hypothetical protein